MGCVIIRLTLGGILAAAAVGGAQWQGAAARPLGAAGRLWGGQSRGRWAGGGTERGGRAAGVAMVRAGEAGGQSSGRKGAPFYRKMPGRRKLHRGSMVCCLLNPDRDPRRRSIVFHHHHSADRCLEPTSRHHCSVLRVWGRLPAAVARAGSAQGQAQAAGVPTELAVAQLLATAAAGATAAPPARRPAVGSSSRPSASFSQALPTALQ